MKDVVFAPWTQKQVDALNRYQKDGNFHPYTCHNNRNDDAHRKYASEREEDNGTLVATVDGWKCPVCGYTQDWAHPFILGEGE